MGLGLGLGHRHSLSCTECGQDVSDGKHAADCLLGQLYKLQERQTHMTCPKCGQNAVDLNVHDRFECRACHTQFGRGSKDGVPLQFLDSPLEADLILVYALPELGDGKIRIDEAIARIEASMDARDQAEARQEE